MNHQKRYLFLIPLFIVLIVPILIFSKLYNSRIENIIQVEPTLDNFKVIEYYKKEYSNNEIIAKLEIPNLFNILITQSKDNEYYLNHSISKKSDKKGTEFMDYRVNINSKQINIYGHNSQTYNLPFRKIEKYLDKKFFDENKYIILSDDNYKSVYQILLIKEISDDFEHMKIDINNKNVVNHLDKLKENSIHYRELIYNSNTSILVLQTCSYNNQDSYYIIVAIKEEWNSSFIYMI